MSDVSDLWNLFQETCYKAFVSHEGVFFYHGYFFHRSRMPYELCVAHSLLLVLRVV